MKMNYLQDNKTSKKMNIKVLLTVVTILAVIYFLGGAIFKIVSNEIVFIATPILNIGGGKFVAFKVLKKYTRKTNFKDIKQRLFGAYMQEREQAKLIEYFEKKKSEANIKIIRKP